MKLNKMECEDLAYWVGVAQTDGYHKKYLPKNQNNVTHSMVLHVGFCSIPMLIKFREISRSLFQIKGSTYSVNGNNSLVFKFGITRLLNLFNELDIIFSDTPQPPLWVMKNSTFFGAYLAGIIDGDGDVRIKRPRYPQCAIRINSGSPANHLLSAIKSKLGIGASLSTNHRDTVYQGRRIIGRSHRLEFYVSSKNIDFFERYVLDHLAMGYKRKKIRDYVQVRKITKHLNKKIWLNGACGDRRIN